MASFAVAATGAVHQVIVGHLHSHYVLRERPDHLLELVDLVAQVPDAGVALVQPVLQPRDVLVLLPRLGRAARQLTLQVPQPVHHGGAHLERGRDDGGVAGGRVVYVGLLGARNRSHATNVRERSVHDDHSAVAAVRKTRTCV